MNKKLFSIAVVLLLGSASAVTADQTLAHSKSLGMSFIAVGDPWCDKTVSIRVQAEDAGQFAMPDYGLTIQKLGQVLMKQCSAMNNMSITGQVDSRTVWSGSSSKERGWVAQQKISQKPSNATTEKLSLNKIVEQLKDKENEIQSANEVERPAENLVSAPADAMQIGGWKSGGFINITDNAANMAELSSSETGCNIFTFYEVKPEYHPFVTLKGDFTCENGYVLSTDLKRQAVASLFYQGQKRPFAKLSGYWYAGYNLDRGHPKQIVRRYSVNMKNSWSNRTYNVEKLLVWIGEDRDLRAHYFITYKYNNRSHQWNMVRVDKQPIIVLTDNEQLERSPERTQLAQSLARVYEEFSGSKSYNDLKFFVTDKLQDAPLQAYQQALKEANPNPSLYVAGKAVKRRGIPWTIKTTTDFVAKRETFLEAEKKRAEMERQREIMRAEAEKQRAEIKRQRLRAIREKHRESLQEQFTQLAKASNYDRMRFYATLKLHPEQLKTAKIDFNSYRKYIVSPFSSAVQFTHPAMYLKLVNDGEANTRVPIYMLVEADDGIIEKPYPMNVEYNETSEEIDGWMLIQAAPEFTLNFDEEGSPNFSITIQEAVACQSDKCLEEMNAADMMRNWYNDNDLKFAMASEQ